MGIYSRTEWENSILDLSPCPPLDWHGSQFLLKDKNDAFWIVTAVNKIVPPLRYLASVGRPTLPLSPIKGDWQSSHTSICWFLPFLSFSLEDFSQYTKRLCSRLPSVKALWVATLYFSRGRSHLLQAFNELLTERTQSARFNGEDKVGHNQFGLIFLQVNHIWID